VPDELVDVQGLVLFVWKLAKEVNWGDWPPAK
jgi:hypothetical protein